MMNLYLAFLIMFCITAGSSGQRHDQAKFVDGGRLAERKLQRPHSTEPISYNIQSDQHVPKKKISKAKHKQFLQGLLKAENKLKSNLKEIAKQRSYVQRRIQREQKRLVKLQIKQKRVIKTTPELHTLEEKDRKLIAREKRLLGKIKGVQKKICPEKEVVVLYVSVAVSAVFVIILITSTVLYFTLFQGRCGIKKKDEEISIDSKYQEE
ncbi:hypothetical protein LOTGIDRAFT_170774 [Lottia gigantea]|uniref:Uncharacterized protein n=1 Tax=Lottia gigantea TaxID=225164 RepID=V4BAK7_LOTGI|nr:hypothetical protein LOTGIDRAFT_170774 [Lottia gigantea]ESP04531.1 hypothetical protein LOTGIDRAFT_170774 [Lottia gigantea]